MGQRESCERTLSQVRIGHSVSEAEKHHIDQRTGEVQNCLRKHGVYVSKDELPNIAVLGSGGGMRAMVSLLGSLCQLHEEELLNSVMYLSGVSGSTWCMASLYKEPEWSNNLETIKDGIVERLVNGEVTLMEKIKKLVKYSKKDNFSMTDFWAMCISGVVNEIDEHVISDMRHDMEKRSKDPYPIFTVIDQQCKLDHLNKDVWFEITPDESGYSLTGAFVDSSAFGSEFSKGNKIKSCPEADMLYLQGLCGSALAELPMIAKLIHEMLNFGIWTSNIMNPCMWVLSTLNDWIWRQRTTSPGIQTLGIINPGILPLCTMNLGIWPWILNLAIQGMFPEAVQAARSWTWGTTHNFLNNMTVKGIDPSLLKTKTRCYEDAGLLLNSPYFSVLRKEREIDLIISLDFSSGDPFETLKITAKMCEELEIPFPDIVIDPSSEPQDFYVFRKDNAPTVIHIPLFNAVNCPGKVEEYKERYATTTLEYTSDMISDLLEKSGLNIKNNKEKLLKEIRKNTENKI